MSIDFLGKDKVKIQGVPKPKQNWEQSFHLRTAN
jgi:hypothetical protein